ncbi:hypothetical protein PTKIN_Ptkin02bG0073100 [Pterospermum kingtungense]
MEEGINDLMNKVSLGDDGDDGDEVLVDDEWVAEHREVDQDSDKVAEFKMANMQSPLPKRKKALVENVQTMDERGVKYTWSRGKAYNDIFERLDRALANDGLPQKISAYTESLVNWNMNEVSSLDRAISRLKQEIRWLSAEGEFEQNLEAIALLKK